MADLGAHAPNSSAPYAQLPNSWYTIVGGLFEGMQFANFNMISEKIRGYRNCRIFDAEACMTDEASA
eukprot:3659379-Pleurochrysis_carterae.AAC.4